MNLHVVGGKDFAVIERADNRFPLNHDARIAELPVTSAVGASDAAFEPVGMAGARIAGSRIDRCKRDVPHIFASSRILREIAYHNDGPALGGSLDIELRKRIEDPEF